MQCPMAEFSHYKQNSFPHRLPWRSAIQEPALWLKRRGVSSRLITRRKNMAPDLGWQLRNQWSAITTVRFQCAASRERGLPSESSCQSRNALLLQEPTSNECQTA